MASLQELMANAERYSTDTFPTLRTLSIADVTAIWSRVFMRVRQLLLLAKPLSVSIIGLGTFCIQKWKAREDGEMITFQRPLFLLSEDVAQIRDLRHTPVQMPDDTQEVVLDCETIRLHVPYSQQTVQGCLLETLQYFYHVLTTGEDADFTLKDIGTLAVRGNRVEMTFCEDFLLCLNKSALVVQKLFSKRWVISDKETGSLPSYSGRVHLLPEFEIKVVPQVTMVPQSEKPMLERKEYLLHKLLRLPRTLSPSTQAELTAELDKEEPASRLLPQMPRTEGRQDKETFSFPVFASHPEDDPQNLLARIQETKQFFSQLDKSVDIEKWLRNKSPHTELERRVWERIRARKAEKRAEGKSARAGSLGDSKPASSQPQKKAKIPLCPSYPQALVTLHNLLHKQKTTLVNVFKKAGMGGRNISRADFIKVIKQTNIPISEEDLEDIIIFLTAPKRGKYTTTEKLVESQKEWLEIRRKESRETKRGAQLRKATCKTATSPPSAEVKAEELDPTMPVEVTPVHSEPEQGHLTDDKVEEASGDRTQKAIKRKEMKKDKTKWKERSHLEKSAEDIVEEHCFPSTTGSDKGEMVNQYRRKVVDSYENCSKLCKERNINLSDPVLQKGLLHPGDKVIREGKRLRKIRQPGGYYSSRLDDESSSLRKSRSSELIPGNLSEEEYYKLIWREKRETRNDYKFWPGHLLDKIRLCIPEDRMDRSHPLFSCVNRPAYWHI